VGDTHEVGDREATVATTDYRRPKGDESKPWHFCSNCKSWPKENFDSAALPVRKVCAECLALQRREMCTRAEAFV
jgi:hypothetical protein